MQVKSPTWLRVLTPICGAAIVFSFVAGCSAIDKTSTTSSTSSPNQHDPLDAVRNADFRANPGIAGDIGKYTNGATSGQHIAQGPGPWLFPGEERASAAAYSPTRSTGTRLAANEPGFTVGAFGVELNFENADISTVSKSILGDVLGLNFLIDPRVQGTVTLASSGPIPRNQVLTVFESALRTANAAVVRDGDILKVLPLSDTNGTGNFSVGTAEPGFGVSVVPLRYTSAPMMVKMAENFLSRPGAMRADASGNLILIQGTMAEREAALDMIASFDVEWLRNKSVGVYPLKANTPEQMVRELRPIFEDKGGRGEGVIQFEPVSRMNAVMAVAKSPKLLDQATAWIERLDRADGSGTALRTYHMKNGDAKQVVAILNDIFAGQGNATGEGARDQLAPGTSAGQSRLNSLGGSTPGGNNGAGASTGAASSMGGGLNTNLAGGPPGGGAPGGGASGGMGQGASGSPIATAFQQLGAKNTSDMEGGANGKGMVRGVLPDVRITADVPNNAIIIFSNAHDYAIIERALLQIDRPKLQVAIEASVAEVDLTDQLQYGVQYFLSTGNSSIGLFNANAGSTASSGTGTTTTGTTTTGTTTTGAITSAATTVATSLLSQVVPGANLLLGSQTNPGAIISALATLTNVKVLSAPSIVVLDNQPALLEVGDQIPIQTSQSAILSTGTTTNTIQMQNTGVILKVLPHVHPNGTILLEIDQEISNVVNPSQQTLTPTISDRHIHTTVSLASSQTVMLGGLISDQDQSTKSGLPFLQNLQYVGALFGATQTEKQRTEIIIFIRPRLIRTNSDAQSVSQEFREKLDLMRHTSAVIGGPPR